MFRVLALLVVVVLPVTTCSLLFSAKRKVDEKFVSQVEAIKLYYNSGGEEADRNIRYLVGFCANREVDGELPYGFRQVVADAFIFVLRNADDKSINAENFMEVYLNRHLEKVESMGQGLEESSPEEVALMMKIGRRWKKNPKKLGNCLHEQMVGRGWSPETG